MLPRSYFDSSLRYFCSLATRVLKKKKLKINVHRPVGTRVKYDDEGNIIPPLAALGNIESKDSVLQPEKGKILEFAFPSSNVIFLATYRRTC